MRNYTTAVPEDAWKRVKQIGGADLLIGIPSFNNASTIGHVVKTAAEGVVKHFPSLRAVIVDADGGSADGTRQVVEGEQLPDGVEKLALVYQGVAGKGSAFRAIFEIGRALGVKGCVVVDSDLRSITPDWIKLLAAPVMEGEYGYIAPYYVRHKYDGTITNSIAYPMTSALYGVSVRQPIGGDFGFSAHLLDCYLSKNVWESDVARFGIDIWMTTTAINEGFKVGQAQLGAKIHDAKDPAASLGPMFRQVVGTLFGMMKLYESNWRRTEGATPAPLLGEPISIEPEPIPVTVSAMIERFKTAYLAEADFWGSFIARENMAELERISGLAEADYKFPMDLWVKCVYDFAVAYNGGECEPNRVVDSLTGLYYGRTASFCLETAAMTTAQAENQVIDQVVKRFHELKPYLVSRWAKH
jgi:glycosyltransferase involved in cell wall biosynthesis